MIAPEVLDALLAHGATAEMIVAAVKADNAISEAVASERRAKDAERQRRHRASRDVTVTDGDIAEIQDGVSLDKETPQTPKEIKPIPCVRETRARLGYHRLPEGWRPSRPFPAPLQAKVDQWPPGTLDDEIAAMKRWAANAEDKNGKGRKLDWDKALWNWLGRRHDEQHRRTLNGLGRNQSGDGLSATTRAARDVFGVGASH